MTIDIVKAEEIGAADGTHEPARPFWQSLGRGFLLRCPACGDGRLFTSYLKVAPTCEHCGQALHHHRADDAPPYFTMFIVGHLFVPLVFFVERTWHPSLWTHALLWLPSIVLVTLGLLPMVKGAIVGVQWALRMHGFGVDTDPAGPDDGPAPQAGL